MISETRHPGGRPRINSEQTPARFPEGTLARIDNVLDEGEKRSDFLREAVLAHVEKREKARGREAGKTC